MAAAGIEVFETEEFYRAFEFSQPFNLSPSDCETITVAELLAAGGGDLSELAALALGYTENTGSAELRAAITSRYDRVDADQIVVLGAPIEGIYLALRALIEPGARVVTTMPAYDALPNLGRALATEVAAWELEDRGEGWALDLDALERLLCPPTSVLIVNFPHNPTGYLPSRTDLDRIVDVARRRDVWIFSDEMYRGLEYRAADALPSVADLYDKSVVLEGVSKTLGLPGLRLGWLVVKDRALRDRLINYKHYTSMCGPRPTEYLGVCALRAWDALSSRSVGRVRANIERARAFFAAHRQWFRWLPPMAGSVSLAETVQGPAEAMCRRLIADHGIVLLPARFMGAPDRYVRFGLGRAGFGAGLDALAAALA